MKVAVAVIYDDTQRILITQRPLHVPHGGYWEFPGGKLEADELPERALIREIREEVGIDVLTHEYVGEINHDYSDRSVQLLIFKVTAFLGTPECLEGQLSMEWVRKEDLSEYHFPEANQGILDLIALS